MNALSTLAVSHVGDGGTPNLFFVTKEGGATIAVFIDAQDAIKYAESSGAYLIEDRLNGEFWTSPEYEAVQACEVTP